MSNTQFWWHLTRASGIVAWVLVAMTTAWGILLSTRLLKPYDRPAWLLDLHRWLGTLSVATIGLHIGSLIADSFEPQWGASEVLIPFATTWKPGAVAYGIIAMYIVVIIQITSRFMKRIPKPIWHAIHLTSYAGFVLATIHAIVAGTDRSNRLYGALAVAIITLMMALTGIRMMYAGKPRTREVISKRPTPNTESEVVENA